MTQWRVCVWRVRVCVCCVCVARARGACGAGARHEGVQCGGEICVASGAGIGDHPPDEGDAGVVVYVEHGHLRGHGRARCSDTHNHTDTHAHLYYSIYICDTVYTCLYVCLCDIHMKNTHVLYISY